MATLTPDSPTATSLRAASGPTEVRDDGGQTIGFFFPAQPKANAVASPMSREEMERRRLRRCGRSLQEILMDQIAI